ncbi:hypothetical protein [Phenylobacterium aquaticum]|uniref:hypothetical protein n=1 Tax=Phenylobacterium aquaticum TaxID=1763816 RepID=UPI001F5D3FAD|nr:hypothetical protein [Phenylobacterium aquaticum]MCI3132035.1 hypothetical protein [Phenylobacterium aquaticum]
MNTDGSFEIVRLVGAEIDDQAIVEISSLVSGKSDGSVVSPAWLIRLAAEGPLFVARRPCGAQPEIIAMAGLSPDPSPTERGREIVALDPNHAGAELESALRAALIAQAASSSRFPGRHRAPFAPAELRSATSRS